MNSPLPAAPAFSTPPNRRGFVTNHPLTVNDKGYSEIPRAGTYEVGSRTWALLSELGFPSCTAAFRRERASVR